MKRSSDDTNPSSGPSLHASKHQRVESRHGSVVAVPGNAPSIPNGKALLEAYLHPVSVQQFFREHFTRKCLVLRGGGKERLGGLMSRHLYNLSLPQLLQHTASEEISAWFKPGQGGKTTAMLEVLALIHFALLHCRSH